MKVYFRYLGALLFAVTFISCKPGDADSQGNQSPPDATKNYVLLISMDGFRWDYPAKANTPHFDESAQCLARSYTFFCCANL